MTEMLWIVIMSGFLAVFHSVSYGANMPVNCWGPSIGAGAITYKNAVILGLIGQAIGVCAFGPESYSAYAEFLDHRDQLQSHPIQAMYALMWSLVVPLILQIVALWQKVLLPMYLCSVAGTVGAALVFPGPAALNFGHFNSAGLVDGLGAVMLIWVLALPVTMLVTLPAFMWYRGNIFRGEDCLHQMLWNLPSTANWVAIMCGLMLLYGIDKQAGLFPTTAQGACISLAVVGSLASILMTLGVKYVARYLRKHVRPPATVRMSLLGLDEAVVRDIAAADVTLDVKGVMQQMHAYCFDLDLKSIVASSHTLIGIHSSAEELGATLEKVYAPFQALFGFFLSIAWGANNGHLSMFVFQMIRNIYVSGSVPESISLALVLHVASLAGMTIGTVLLGTRLTPITAVGLAKMSPFRSMVAMGFAVEVASLLGIIELKGAAITYCMVSSTVAVGLAEGTSHVNWKLLGMTLLWWAASFFVIIAVTAAFVAQGLFSPSLAILPT